MYNEHAVQVVVVHFGGAQPGRKRFLGSSPAHHFQDVGILVRFYDPLVEPAAELTAFEQFIEVNGLGLGLASTVPGRSTLIDGFGLIAFASLFPIMAVLGYAQIGQWLARRKQGSHT